MFKLSRIYLHLSLLASFLILTQVYAALDERFPSSSSSDWWSQLIYDDSYLTNQLDSRFPYLKVQQNNTTDTSYMGPRDYFNFTNIFEPTVDYYERVNLEMHLFDELKAMEISSSIATMDQWYYSNFAEELNSGKPEADEAKCKLALNFLEAKLKSASETNFSSLFEPGYDNIRFLRWLDSLGRPPSETYHGHSYWIGSYRGCKQAQIHGLNLKLASSNNNTNLTRISKPFELKFRYCYAKITAKSWPEKDLMIPATNFRTGICLPDFCDTRSANKNKQQILRIIHFNFSPLHQNRFNRIIHIYCLPNRNILSPEARLFLLFALIWLSLILLTSIYFGLCAEKYDSHNKKIGSSSSFLRSLSIQENFKKFISDDEPPKSRSLVDLRPMGLMRFFASIVICIGHCGCSFGWVFNSSTFAIQEYRRYTFLFLPSMLKFLDIFLVLSGITTSYIILARFAVENVRKVLKPSFYAATILARYLRLAPVAILSLTFMKSVYPYLSEGPNWDYGTYEISMQGQCQRSSWWRTLIFPILFSYKGNNFLNECLSVSWYLVADLKLALVAPFLIYLMCRKATPITQRFLIILAIVTLSTLSQYIGYSTQKLLYFQQFFKYGQLFGINILNLTFGETSYFSAINRIHSFAVGILAGYYLHAYGRGNINKWPFWMRGFCFWAIIAFQIYDFFTPYIAQYRYLNYNELPSENVIKLAMLLKPRTDAIIFSIVTLRLVTDLAPKLMKHSMVFYKLSKLSYCVFLVHTILISYVVSAHERSRPDTLFMQFLLLTTFVTIISFMISFPVYLLFESPLAQLSSKLFSQKSSSPKISVLNCEQQQQQVSKQNPLTACKQE